MSHYIFNTRTFFLLAKFLRHFQSEIKNVVNVFHDFSVLQTEDREIDGVMVPVMASSQLEKLFSIILSVLGTVAEAEADAIALIAHATNNTVETVQDWEAYEFIKVLREFLLSINWTKLMGESLGLSLDLPLSENNLQPSQPQSSSETSSA
jgi:hypothetical protein